MSLTNYLTRTRNEEAYATQRGRRCAECGSKIAYDRELGTKYCGLHQHLEARNIVDFRPRKRSQDERGRPTGILLSGLHDIRKSVGLSQAQLGRLTGINPRTISHYERGASGANPKRVLAISKALGVTVEELI